MVVCAILRIVPMLMGCAISFLLISGAWLALAFAANIFIVLVATIVRSVGSNVVWVYSSLILQVRVPNTLLGRILAVEMAFHTVWTLPPV